ncbi:hypothetical protein [Asanoa iriomotensis]|uniref:hypothetical protein n=2 Tax=Asanoa iriomotensis TaxID=234613 RepID=UPI001941AB8D|nr:hypothetical protein [Asanoa iriomotensis]
MSQWDPLGASGGELAAITQLEDTASFKLPKDLFEGGPPDADDGDMVIVPTGGSWRGSRDEPPTRSRRRRDDDADDEIELSSGGRRRRDVSDSRAARVRADDVELSSGGRRRRDISDSRAAGDWADDVELTSGGRRRRDVAGSRAVDDDIELSSGGRRRREAGDSRAGRFDDAGDIELTSGGGRRRSASDSRADRFDDDSDIELTNGGRRRRDGGGRAIEGEIELAGGGRRRLDASDSRAGRFDETGDVELSSGGRRRRDVTDSRAGRAIEGEIELASGGRRRLDASDSRAGRFDETGDVELSSGGRRRRDVTDSRAARDWSDGSTDIELSSGGRRRLDAGDSRARRWDDGDTDVEQTSGGRRRRAADGVEPAGRGRRRTDDGEADTGRRSWRDEATDTELPSIGYAASAPVEPSPGGRRARTDDEPLSRGRRRRHGAADETGSRGWQAEPTETELPDLSRPSDTGTMRVPLRGRSSRHAEDADEPSQTWHGESAGRGRRGRHGETDTTDGSRRGWSDGSTDPETTGTRLSRRAAEDEAPPARGRRRHGEPDPIESTGHGRTWSERADDRPRGRSRHAEADPVDPPSRSRRARQDETDADPRGWRDEAEQTGHGRRAAERDPRGRGRDEDPAARGWRGEGARGDVPTQRRRARDDGDPPAGGDASDPRRGSWAGEPDSDRWRHPDMTGEWSRRAMAPIEPDQERPDDQRTRDDRPGPDDGRHGRSRATRDAAGTETGDWRAGGRARRDSGHRPSDDGVDTGSWERMTDTGQYDSTTSTGEWDRLVGSIDDEAEEKFEAFWSGHRLAGDDPRWVETPATAPRSPAIGLPEPRRPEPDGYDDGGPRRGRSQSEADRAEAMARAAVPPALDATDPGWGAPARAARQAPAPPRQAQPQPQRRPMRWQQEEFEQLDTDNGGFLAAVLYAAAWYAVPVLAFGIWLMTLPAVAVDDCVSDVTGGGCDSPRAQALEGLLSGVPHFGVALGISLIAAVALRWLGHSWRAGSVGLAAAVVGGGLAAVLNSVLTGQPLG